VNQILVMILGVLWPVETWYCTALWLSKNVWTGAESFFLHGEIKWMVNFLWLHFFQSCALVFIESFAEKVNEWHEYISLNGKLCYTIWKLELLC
jgi:hypothetical protein